MNAVVPFPVYDADHHIYEPEEAFYRHLPKKYQNDFYFVERKGRTKLVINGMLSDYIPNPTFTVVAAPGSHEKWFRANNTEGLSLRELTGTPVRPPKSWLTGEGRTELLDEQGLHAAIIFPTLASVIEERLGDKPETTCALIHSLNEWFVDEGGYDRGGRIYPTAYISLADLDMALETLEFALHRGAKVVAVRPAPVPGIGGSTSFGFPKYDPFWARCAEAGVLVCLHCSDSGYDRITNWWKGRQGEALAFERDAFQATVDMVGRAISDSISALICHGALARHPNLRIASVENGSAWVRPLLHRLQRAYGQMPGAFAENPIDTFHRHVFVAPFYEDDPADLRDIIPVERMLFGSDFPHAEGLTQPLQYLEEFKAFKPDEVEKVFSSNLKGLLEGQRN
jgi:predicted TIM-barrel fold metal-dependent hydrolase